MARGKNPKKSRSPVQGQGVRSFKDRLSLRLPRSLFDGDHKIVALGLQDNADNRRVQMAFTAGQKPS
ncbi:MAG: hypothetical protein AB4352_19410 [Hormoscilla sp.]